MSFDRIWCALADGEPASAAFRIGTEFTSGFCFCLSSLWYWAAVRWVDKRATWFKGFPLRADILVFVEDLVVRKTAARSLRLRGLALLLHFETPFLQSTRTLDTAQDAPELFEYLGYRSLGQPLWLMVSVVL